jgi:hypothetical protein
MPDRTRARELAAEFNRKGDPTGWFEALYREAEAGKSVVPWVDLCPNPYLLGFWKAHPQPTAGKSALVIGCALGDDAEVLASWGFQATAFDISETAIRGARKRYPKSTVEYHAANLLDPPSDWRNYLRSQHASGAPGRTSPESNPKYLCIPPSGRAPARHCPRPRALRSGRPDALATHARGTLSLHRSRSQRDFLRGRPRFERTRSSALPCPLRRGKEVISPSLQFPAVISPEGGNDHVSQADEHDR